MKSYIALLVACAVGFLTRPAAAAVDSSTHTFAIGDTDFLLDGQRLQIRCGELHFARIPREYWRDRLHRAHAMGLNTVCAYLFWNFHEQQPGKFDWYGEADAAEFCRLAQEEGLWVILRPGPYACAEWEMGGLPWWLLKEPDIKLRTRDPRFIAASRAWLAEVGRVLGPLQVNRGGPILMVQVENEYGFFGNDVGYLEDIHRAVADAGFTVPLFICNPTDRIGRPAPADLFKVVNFGKDPAGAFKALRAVQPLGPLMCGEFYPGWFDTWGAPHHLGNTPQYLADLEYMLSHGASFSIYMAHGGTTFGLWSGADQPFKPDTSSYDYDAPIAENGALGAKFAATRALMQKYLLPGEKLPDPPAPNPTMAITPFTLDQRAALFTNLPHVRRGGLLPTMETLDQGAGAVLYRTTLAPGPAATLAAAEVHDFGFVYLDGMRVGIMDRRTKNYHIELPAREKPTQLDVLVYALGRVNFGAGVHDRKGLHAPVTLSTLGTAPQPFADWSVYSLPLDISEVLKLAWQPAGTGDAARGPAFWRGHFTLKQTEDTYLNLGSWTFGVVWVNGRCLGRFWNIGPTQTMYIPGPWLQPGRNEVVVFDLLGPAAPVLAGFDQPVLDRLRPENDFTPGIPASK
jgi:beta-galactosidase